MITRVAAVVVLLASPAAAAPVALLDGPAFAARVTGHTLHWTEGSAPAGVESYLPGQRVIWRAPDGRCETGRWTADGARICFLYDNAPGPVCWLFAPEGEGLVARSMTGDAGAILRSSAQTETPLSCGPGFGV